MNSENFHEYLKNPSMLHQVSYQELKSLVMQYPFSPNLRYLLLVKSLIDQHKDYDRNLVIASMSTPDRSKLRKLVKQFARLREIQENYALNEEFLELKDLSSLESIIDAMPEEQEIVQEPLAKGLEQVPPTEVFSTPQVEEEASQFLHDNDDFDFLDQLMAEDATEAVVQAPEDSDAFEAVDENEEEIGEPAPSNVELDNHSPTLESLIAFDEEEPLPLVESSDYAIHLSLEEEVPATENIGTEPEAVVEEDTPSQTAEGAQEEAVPLVESLSPSSETPADGLENVGEIAPSTVGDDDPSKTQEAERSENADDAFAPGEEEGGEDHEDNEDPALAEPAPMGNAIQVDFEVTPENQAEDSGPATDPSPAPLPKTNFQSWPRKRITHSHGILQTKLQDLALNNKIPNDLPDNFDDASEPLFDDSVVEDDEIVSETLALILEKQSHFGKAIAMYQRLCLQYPEKSSLFAAKIEELNRKL